MQDEQPEPIRLTHEQQEALRRKSSAGILRALVAQGVMLAVAVLVSWWLGGAAGAASALAGGLAYFVPNALFAMRLLLGLLGGSRATPVAFFLGEAFKLGSAIVVLGVVGWYGRHWLVWPALLFGLVCVLKGYVLLLMFRRLP